MRRLLIMGPFPERLEQAIAPVPTDPFDLKPLRYHREGAGFAVYSIGKTGRFNGSAADARQHNLEAVFRYPMPAFLKVPSK